MSDATLQSLEGQILATLIVVYVLAFAIRRLKAQRPELRIGLPVAIGVAARLAASACVAASGLSSTLRGGDETTFLAQSHHLAAMSWDSGFWIPDGVHHLYEVLFAVQLKLAGFTPGALRVSQVGIAMLGVVLIVAAIDDLAGARAARLGAWVLALEPAGLFFDSALHKEPLMMLASGLVVFGGARIWRRLDLSGVLIAGLGGLVALETRPYAGWFLVSAIVLLVLHYALRRPARPLRAMPLLYAVVLVACLAAPALNQVTSSHSLRSLQQSQNANANPSPETRNGAPNGNNLALEQVNFSTRSAVVTNLPRRIRDVLFRPYPWQLQDISQQLGAIGSVVGLAALAFLFGYAWRSRGRIFARAGPIIYPLAFLLIAYALSVGNAGTGFRYRTHLITLAIAVLVVLREHVLDGAAAREPSAEHPSRSPIADARASSPAQPAKL
ncbi:MAG TPA: hypothetical protein VHE14_07695 [Solirubrobacteraceae bacterium]|nr:hypothetical protein [Solirubrobacteraceae bacterium]